MGLLLNLNEYGELADAPANDGAAAMIGAIASEAIGKVTEWLLKDNPDLVTRMLSTARINEVNALANHALAASLHRNLTALASLVTNPIPLAYYQKLIAQAAADMASTKATLAGALGLADSLSLVDMAKRAYGDKMAAALGEGIGKLASGAWTAAKLKDIIDNPS